MSVLNMDFEKKKYINMENVLQQINQDCISLSNDSVKRNNEILNQVIVAITDKMKQIDPLFKLLYTTVFYGGSYFDGLKVGEPEEYDLDLLLKLPKFGTPKVKTSNIPGFMHVQLETFEKLVKQPEFQKYKAENEELTQARNFHFQNRYNHKKRQRNINNNYRTKLHLTKTQRLFIQWRTETGRMGRHMIPRTRALLKLVDDQFYLLTSKVSRWFEGVLCKALQHFNKKGNGYVLDVSYGELMVSVHKGGPAFTLKIIGQDVKFDIDFVPCFVFKNSWPEGGYRNNPCKTKLDFFVVPKQPKQLVDKSTRYWRLSFQEQERALLNQIYPRLKPSLRLLKKLRDTLNRNDIASYYIKTIFLWEIIENNGDIYKHSLSYAFMKMLYILQAKIEKKEILYFWNRKNNLIGSIRSSTLTDIANQLRNIIKDINNHLDEPHTIVKYLCTLDYNMARLSLQP